MQATNTPTSWTATGLPPGLAIGSAGLVSGAATAAGVYLVKVIATNSTGPSAPLEVAMGIEDSNFNDGLGIEVNIDLRSGAVSVPGITPTSTGSQATLFLKYGDKVFLDLGFFKGEELQSMAMASAILNIREFDGETVLVQSNGGIENVGTTDRPRYRILVDLEQPNLLAALGNYEDDYQTTFDAVAEIEWRVDYLEPGALANEVIRSSKTFRIGIDRDLVPNP
jgi:hypothetical protein